MSLVALISVFDKTGLLPFAERLVNHGVTIISTGGTATVLRKANISVIDVSDITDFPEILDGRVKTLHPKIYGGLLARRNLAEHQAVIKEHNIQAIDFVIVNCYPFADTVQNSNSSFDDAIENIDIGGPCMLRAAAKNHEHITVIVDPNDYDLVINSLQQNGSTSYEQRLFFAQKVFEYTAAYDATIFNYLTKNIENKSTQEFPKKWVLPLDKITDMRYGENPHQKAAFYKCGSSNEGSIGNSHQIQGKSLSFNNIKDADTAWECVKIFNEPACVIVKHSNPCGVAVRASIVDAYKMAYQSDSTSAFGGVIACNRPVNAELAQAMLQQFFEVLIAPSFDEEAISLFRAKPTIRLLQASLAHVKEFFDIQTVSGYYLVQTSDFDELKPESMSVVTKRQPKQKEWADLIFSWKVSKFVKSNAIVFCRDETTVAIGAGQMSRVDSVRIAVDKASSSERSLLGTAVASDAFFPFKDGIEVLAKAGASCIIQPGGSIRDEEVIDAANHYGLSMVFTHIRHFKH